MVVLWLVGSDRSHRFSAALTRFAHSQSRHPARLRRRHRRIETTDYTEYTEIRKVKLRFVQRSTRGLAAPLYRLPSAATFGRWIHFVVRFVHPKRCLRYGRINATHADLAQVKNVPQWFLTATVYHRIFQNAVVTSPLDKVCKLWSWQDGKMRLWFETYWESRT